MSKAYEVITERIASMLAGGKIPWRRPWSALKASPVTNPDPELLQITHSDGKTHPFGGKNGRGFHQPVQ